MKILVFVILFIQVFRCSAEMSKVEQVEEVANAVPKCGDSDNNGYVTKEEFRNFLLLGPFDALMKKVGGKEAFIKRHFKVVDTHHYGAAVLSETKKGSLIYGMTLQECLKGGEMTEVTDNATESKSRDEATILFKCYDLNSNGFIHLDEIKRFYTKRPSYTDVINADGLESFTRRTMVLYDVNEDGLLSKQEFVDITTIYLLMTAICH